MRFSYLFLSFCLLVLAFLGCDKNHPTKPATTASWERVSEFGTEPIWSLYANADSTELNIMGSYTYACKFAGTAEDKFVTSNLTYPINYVHQDSIAFDGIGRPRELPYFTDTHCFYCNDEHTLMYIYEIGSGRWQKVGQLSVYDFIDPVTIDSVDYSELFGHCIWYNITNHIQYYQDDLYYIAVEVRCPQDELPRIEPSSMKSNYRHFLVSMSLADGVSVEKLYETEPIMVAVNGSFSFSNACVNGNFLQDIFVNYPHRVLVPESSEYIVGGGLYPIRERFFFNDYLVGLGDNIIDVSFDNGLNWENWLTINGLWSHACVAGKHVMYYLNNVAHWQLEIDPRENIMLESDALTGLRIHTMLEFDGIVYAATNQGLFKRPASTFFTPRDETRSNGEVLMIQ